MMIAVPEGQIMYINMLNLTQATTVKTEHILFCYFHKNAWMSGNYGNHLYKRLQKF